MMLKPHPSQILPVALFWLFANSAYGVDEEAVPAAEKEALVRNDSWTFNFYFENDLFVDTDSNYTNGVKVSWISPDLSDYSEAGQLPDSVYRMGKYLPFVNAPGIQRNVVFTFGQNMYTPQDLTRQDLIVDDRPYAGWLYFGVAMHNKTEWWLDTVEVNIGVVGPAALAEQAQKIVHEIRDAVKPEGWDNQLENEPALNFVWERKIRLWRFETENDLGFDFIAHGGTSLGTTYVYGNAGAQVRAGWRIPLDFGSGIIRLAGDTNSPARKYDYRLMGGEGLGIHLFGGIDGRYVFHDMMLDGNIWHDSHSVDKRRGVFDVQMGLSMTIRHWKLSYGRVYRSREFEQQSRYYHAFGSMTFSFTF